jgi:thiol-disulfide isomerase/thioredoxin
MKTESKTAIILGVAIVAVVAGISVGFSSIESETFEPSQTIIQKEEGSIQVTSIDKSRYKMAPNLAGIANYINTTPEQLAKDMEGKVVLYDIWTYSCINCVRTLPYITTWNEKYSDDGLLIIGIHSPEFEFEKDLDNVQMAVDKHGIKYPVVLDNDWETWKAFENRYWPRKYIADHEGYIRYDHIGEGAYQETEKIIQQLLEERAMSLGMQLASAESLVDIEEFQHTSFRTPELYFGYKFAQNRNQLGNSEGFNPGNEVTYFLPENFQQHYFYVDGTWENLEGSMKLVSETGSIVLLYHAKEVNIVTANIADLEIFLDDEPIPASYSGSDVISGKLKTTEAGLYNIVSSMEPASHILKINISEPGFEIYTFTFG